jgi:predicted ABC-type ATPase
MDLTRFDARPIVVALAGPNGAGKTTFFHAFLQLCGLRFVNADLLTRAMDLTAYAGAELADRLRRELVAQKESFVFETVLSDPAGRKIEFLEEAARGGYTTLLCYIGVASAHLSEERVAMRVSQGGHDVPTPKLQSRYGRSLANLALALGRLPNIVIYDNTDLGRPFQRIAEKEDGRLTITVPHAPRWLGDVLSRMPPSP